jgi:hypothetical protein
MELRDAAYDRAVAVHEAGHFIARWALDLGTDFISIEEGQDYDGRVVPGQNDGYACRTCGRPGPCADCGRTDSPPRERTITADIVVKLAGVCAENRCAPINMTNAGFGILEPTDDGPHRLSHASDADQAFTLATEMCADEEEVDALLAWLYVRTTKLLTFHWPQLEAVADALVERRRLTGEEAASIVRDVEPAYPEID